MQIDSHLFDQYHVQDSSFPFKEWILELKPRQVQIEDFWKKILTHLFTEI
jgi:hypothetical protein